MTQALETTNGKAVAPPIEHAISAVEQALYMNDLSKLTPPQRVELVNAICRSTGLNPLTKPMEYITLNGKLTLYATRACTDQLRQIHGVSITGITRERDGDLYIVTARAQDRQGRIDESTGVLNVKGLGGEALANALMKAETKSKRRVTLSICGLGMLDESEVGDAQSAPHVSEWREPEAVGEIAAPESAPVADEDGVVIEHEEAPAAEVSGDPWDELQERMRKAKLSKSFVEGVMYPHPFSDDGLASYLAEAKRPVADLVEDAIGRRG